MALWLEFAPSSSAKKSERPPFLPFFSYPFTSGKGLPMFADERFGKAPNFSTRKKYF
jgi:hypothetical protein